MTNEEKLYQIFPDGVCPFSRVWLSEEYQEPTTKNNLGVDAISREQALVAIRNLYPGMPRVDFNGSLRKWVDKYKPYIECDDAIKQLPSVTPQLSSELEKNSKLEKIRDQLKSNLRGVEITLEVLVENDPLRPKMEGAKTTLEDCLELIDKAEAESI